MAQDEKTNYIVIFITVLYNSLFFLKNYQYSVNDDCLFFINLHHFNNIF